MERMVGASKDLYFLNGGGEMGALTRAYDWSRTSLGAPDTWPESLRTMVSVVLRAKFPMFLWWGDDLIQFYNDAYRPSLGKEGKHPAALGSKGVDTWVEIWPVIKPLIDSVLAGGEATWSEDQLIPIYRNGRLEDVYWTFSYSPVMGDAEKVLGVLVTCTETTEKVISFRKLQESEERLRFALDSAHLGAWKLDLSTMVLDASDHCKANFGQPVDRPFSYQDLKELVHPMDRKRMDDAVASVMALGHDYCIEYRVVWPDASIHWVDVRGRLRYGEKGEPIEMIGISVDITERKNSEQKLKESEQRFRMLIEEAPIATCLFTGPELKIEIANEKVLSIWGKGDSVLGKPLAVALPELEGQPFLDILQEVYATGMPYEAEAAKAFLRVDGVLKTFYFDFAYKPLFDSKGEVYGIMDMGIDVTEQVLAKKRIEDSERRFRKLIEEAPIATCLFTGLDMKIDIANEKMLDVWGKGNAVLGKPLASALPELDGQPFLKLLHEVYTTGIAYEEKAARADLVVDGVLGTYYFDYTYKPLFDGDGQVYGIMDMAVDVTEQVKAQNDIKASEERFRALIEESPIATTVLRSRELIVELVNEPTLNLWGRDRKLIGEKVVDLVPSEQAFVKLLEEVFDTGKTLELKAVPSPSKTEEGVVYYYDCIYKALRNSHNEVDSILAMAVNVTEQVLVQKRIEQSQKELLDSFVQAPVAIATISEENLTFRMVNPAYAELVGRNIEDIIDRPLLEALPEIAGQGFDDLIKGVIATGIPFVANEVGVDLVRRNGITERLYVDLTYQPRREGTSDKVNGVLVVAVDTTQQVLARRSIEESEAKLRSILDNAPAGIGLFMGRDLIIENPNQTFIDIVGKGSGIVGLPLKEAMPELLTEGQPFLQILDEVFTTGIGYQSFGSLVKIVQNGVMTHKYYNITYTPVFDKHGNVYAILDIAIDVTEQIKAQKALEEAEAELRNAIEVAGLATWTLDIKRNVFIYSQRFMEWLGFTEDTKNLDEAYNPLPEEFRKSVPAAIAKTIARGASGFYQNEHPIVNRVTGQTRIIHAQGQVMYDASGDPILLKGIAQDITLHRQMQLALEAEVVQRTEELKIINRALTETNKQLMHSNEELAQFAYIASHDLQEPLRKISTFSDLLEKNLKTSNTEQSSRYLAKIISSSARMTTLIKDVLQYSQLVKNQESFERLDLNKVIYDIISEYDLLIEQKRATIKLVELPIIEAIPLQMNQLFRNLISNALKYNKLDVFPIIDISFSKIDAIETMQRLLDPHQVYYKIQFRDNGIGFSQEHAEKVFTIFQRLHLKSEYEGAGIGLAMCKKIVLNHHGDIDAEGIPQVGATFNVILPERQFNK